MCYAVWSCCVTQIWIITLEFHCCFQIFKSKIVLFFSNYKCLSTSIVRGAFKAVLPALIKAVSA
jgi:hypothetical protein